MPRNSSSSSTFLNRPSNFLIVCLRADSASIFKNRDRFTTENKTSPISSFIRLLFPESTTSSSSVISSFILFQIGVISFQSNPTLDAFSWILCALVKLGRDIGTPSKTLLRPFSFFFACSHDMFSSLGCSSSEKTWGCLYINLEEILFNESAILKSPFSSESFA